MSVFTLKVGAKCSFRRVSKASSLSVMSSSLGKFNRIFFVFIVIKNKILRHSLMGQEMEGQLILKTLDIILDFCYRLQAR